ncbi:DUF1176 domain-containing protein [Nodosilinea sp. E11]|uniref:DUF1176 domain-containing protein n=1 Tax=Nodosilinea sp. E11 TaxID=3037479 RepID=UPI002935110E|nr:DUF1176 domain-containing protein [Nodosilinea sp. E11]WOD40070.1 DUF1176 domain-containing protein [Nodosilinea sp. E11]
MNHTQRLTLATLAMFAIAACNAPAPPAPAEPESGQLPADEVIFQTVYDQVESLDLCDGFFQPEVTQAESQVYALGDWALVELVCAQAAYQLVYAYVAYQADGSWQPLSLDGFAPDETGAFGRTSETTVGGLATFDPEPGVLTIFSKARGLGDCGSLADYRWSEGRLELETFRYQACSATAEEFVEPGDYPQIYP